MKKIRWCTAIILLLQAAALSGETVYDRIFNSTHDYFVTVNVKLQKDEKEKEDRYYSQHLDYQIRQAIKDKKDLEFAGILYSRDGRILISDFGFNEKYLGAITVTDRAGKQYVAEPYGWFQHLPAQLLRLKEYPTAGQDLTFVSDPPDFNRQYYMVTLKEFNGKWHELIYSFSTVGREFYQTDNTFLDPWTNHGLPGPSMHESGHTDIASNPAIVCDDQGSPAGIFTDNTLGLDRTSSLWQAADVYNDRIYTVADLEAARQRLLEKYNRHLVKVVFKFREKSMAAGNDRRRTVTYYGPGSEKKDETERTLFGVAVAGRKIFIPESVEAELIKRIDKILIGGKDAQTQGVFLGSFTEFHGMMVELPETMAVPPLDIQATAPERLQPLLYLRQKEKYGAEDVDSGFLRFTGIERVYKNMKSPVASKPVEPGTLFFDLASEKLAAVKLILKRDGEKKKKVSDESSYNYYSDNDAPKRIFLFQELKDYVDRSGGNFDVAAMPVSKDEEKRLVWLGVEFSKLDMKLAKQLKVEDKTRSGEFGLLITMIYPGSPAEGLGLKEGDILIELREAGEDDFTKLVLPREYNFDYEYSFDFDLPEGVTLPPGFQMPSRKPFRSRDNYLTRLLTVIGTGKEIELKVITGDEIITRAFTTELAPPDFDSTEKYKNEEIGLTVKDITYEVRTSMRLEPNQQGIIIAEIEPGSPAAVAKLDPFEFIVKVDDTDISTIADFKKILEQKKNDGTEKMNLLILNPVSGTKLVDIHLQ